MAPNEGNGEWLKMRRKEVVVASFQILSRHFRGDANVNHNNLHNTSPVQDLKPCSLHTKQEDRSEQTCRPVNTRLYKILTALHYPNGGENRFYRVTTHIISRRQYCRLNWFRNGRCTHTWIRKVIRSNLDSNIRRSADTVRKFWPWAQWDPSSNFNPCTNISNLQFCPVKVNTAHASAPAL
jgi:hypothetical protein